MFSKYYESTILFEPFFFNFLVKKIEKINIMLKINLNIIIKICH